MTLAAVSTDIKTLLDANGFGTDGDDLFAFEWGSDIKGAEIDKQTLILDTEAIPSDLKKLYEQPVFLILVRGTKNEAAKTVHDRARAIWEFLIIQETQDINGVSYLQFEPIDGMIPLGRDGNKRFVYSMTFYTFRNPK